jgi:6,7-dimethyl-8-ribityllumazine synthase
VKLAIVVSDFNIDVTSQMLERARNQAELLGAEVARVVRVFGVYDMPVVVKRLLQRKDVDGVVMLGAVIKGDTKHDEVVISAAANAGAQLAVEFGKPVGLGITGPGMTREQAFDRLDNARNAVEAVVRVARLLAELGE